MRLLVAITSGFGHIRPSAPIAAAARRRGHEVRYVVSASDRLVSGNSRGSGAIAPSEFATGLGFPTDVVEPADITSLLDCLPEPESDGAAVFRPFFLRAVAAVPFIGMLCDEWRPDVILRDTAGLDASAIAELANTPLATFDFAPALSGMLEEVAAGEIAWFRREVGLPPEPDCERLQNELTIVGAPPSWLEGHSLPVNTHLVQPMEPEPAPGESVTALLDSDDERPLVYVTFGTVFNTPDLFQRVFDAVADLDVQVIATIGMNNDAGDLDVPRNVRTVPFLSQSLILEHADLVVAHGGYGSLTGALKRGLPVLSLPLAPPDNRFNAAQLAKLGAGLALGQDERTPDEIRRSLRRLLEHREYRDCAREIADEIAALPPIDHAVELIERLTVSAA
jgi:UDP:flavonoid glycosyltransferase YjiC (YdhE family)